MKDGIIDLSSRKSERGDITMTATAIRNGKVVRVDRTFSSKADVEQVLADLDKAIEKRK